MRKQLPPKLSTFLTEFKTFINKGSVADLAVGVIIGGAFSKIVSSLVSDMLMPMIGVLLGGVNLSALAIDIPNLFGGHTSAHIAYGNFLQNIVDFLIIAISVFFFIRLLNRVQKIKKSSSSADQDKDQDNSPDTELSVLLEIRDHLKSSKK